MNIRIEGLQKTLQRLDINKFKPQIQVAFNKFGIRVELDAKQNVVVDEGRLRASIFQQPGELSSTFGASVKYAAYVEFGTGPFAAVYVKALPDEWQKYAMTFFVNGKGRLPAHPFIYPAFFKNKFILLNDLKKMKT